MASQRLQFVKAQLKPKPGAKHVVARLLGPQDLPGEGWRVADERTWRTGEVGPGTPYGERAREIGSVTAWRSFRNRSAGRWAWIQIAQLGSPGDAEAALDGIWERGLTNLAAPVRLVSDTEIATGLVAGATAVRAREQHTEGRPGGGVVLMLAAAAEDWLIALSLSGSPGWDWPTASSLAAAQASRLGTAAD
ncbi:MAG TPA: hypothetical protein VGI58_19625 [Streptosporangiaceae bacterium]|jgi:hypothetical protein